MTDVEKTEARAIDPLSKDRLEDFGGETVDRGDKVVDGKEYKGKSSVLIGFCFRPRLNVRSASKTREGCEIIVREALRDLREWNATPSAITHRH